jgi:SPP1 gp7 family putative phage head morphogenesis protein
MTARAARRRTRQPRRKLKKRVPSRAARYAASFQPAHAAELRYRIAMRKLVATWWTRVGPGYLSRGKKIAEPEPEERTDARLLDDDAPDHLRLDASDASHPAWFLRSIDNVANDVTSHTAREAKRIGIRLKDADPAIAKLVPKWRRENVDLVSTMFADEKDKLEQLLADGAGRTWSALAKDIGARFDITTRHAELIARDQTNKLTSRIAQARMASAGVTSYIFTTAGNERVRPMHAELDGQQFDFDDPPVTNEDGDTNNPGEDFQCSCVATPVLPEFDDDAGDDDAPPEEDDSDD